MASNGPLTLSVLKYIFERFLIYRKSSLPEGNKFLDLNISAIKTNLKKFKYIFNKPN
jgi:hypothetical protein